MRGSLAETVCIDYHSFTDGTIARSGSEVERVLPSDREPDEIKRESIWSVKEEDRHKFSYYFSILFSIGLVFSLWYEIVYVVDDGIFDTIIALMRDVGIAGLCSATLSFARFEMEDSMGIALELFRKQRYEEGHAEGIDIGRAEGIDIGIERGRAEGRAERDALKKQIAELKRRNGASPDDSRSSQADDDDEE